MPLMSDVLYRMLDAWPSSEVDQPVPTQKVKSVRKELFLLFFTKIFNAEVAHTFGI